MRLRFSDATPADVPAIAALHNAAAGALDLASFTPVKRPLYLTGMAVSVAHQRQGLGRQALGDARAVAAAWPADAIRLDAFDAEAGAGAYSARCGYSERGRVVYRGDPLVYYELVLG